jgi:hypothetical protein
VLYWPPLVVVVVVAAQHVMIGVITVESVVHVVLSHKQALSEPTPIPAKSPGVAANSSK